MPIHKPVTLPAEFGWEDCNDEAVLRCHGVEVLRVLPVNAGWAVDLQLHSPTMGSTRVITPSRGAGMCWAARWAKARLTYLRKTVCSDSSLRPDATSVRLSQIAERLNAIQQKNAAEYSKHD